MAIEIKELHLKFNLENRKENGASDRSQLSETKPNPMEIDTEKIVALCVDEVMRVMEDKLEER